jgi:hypothetical protein
MVHQRRIRYLVIDEALHLLRHDQYERLMDTLKSLANIGGTQSDPCWSLRFGQADPPVWADCSTREGDRVRAVSTGMWRR